MRHYIEDNSRVLYGANELVGARDMFPQAVADLWHGHLRRGALELGRAVGLTIHGVADIAKAVHDSPEVRPIIDTTDGGRWASQAADRQVRLAAAELEQGGGDVTAIG